MSSLSYDFYALVRPFPSLVRCAHSFRKWPHSCIKIVWRATHVIIYIYALARISHYLSDHKRKILMKSFIISQFNYCPIIWMYCQRKCNHRINRIHERALRIAYNDYVSDFNVLLENDHSITIHERNIQNLILEIYKTLNNLNPTFMKEIFYLKEHVYSTRKKYLVYPTHIPSRMGWSLSDTKLAKFGAKFHLKRNKIT